MSDTGNFVPLKGEHACRVRRLKYKKELPLLVRIENPKIVYVSACVVCVCVCKVL